jgi:trimeric autotransporter adhesin
MLIFSALIPLVQETSQKYPWWDANGQKALLCESKKGSITQPRWCRFVKHDPPPKPADEEQKKKEEQPALPASPTLRALLVSTTAVVMLLLGWLRYNRQQQQLPPAAATPKSERRGTVLPTRRNSVEERQSTAAADEDRPAAELGQAAAHLADAALADAAHANTAAAQQPDQPGQLLAADLHADDPIEQGPVAPDASADELQPPSSASELAANGHEDGAAAPQSDTASAAEMDAGATADDDAPPQDTATDRATQLSSDQPGGLDAENSATAAAGTAGAASTAAAAEPELATTSAPDSTSPCAGEPASPNSSSSRSSAESDVSTVGPTSAPIPVADSITSNAAAPAGRLHMADRPFELTTNLPLARVAPTLQRIHGNQNVSPSGLATLNLSTGGTAQQLTLPTGDGTLETLPAPPAPSALSTAATTATATAATATAAADAETSTSNDRIVALYEESSDGGSDADYEQDLPHDGDVDTPQSPDNAGSEAFPGGTDDDVYVVDESLRRTPEQVRADYDSRDPHLYFDALQLCQNRIELICDDPYRAMVHTYNVRCQLQLLRTQPRYPSLASIQTRAKRAAAAAPAVAATPAVAAAPAAAAAVEPEQEERPRFPLTSIQEESESDVESVDDDGAPHALHDEDSYDDAPAETTRTAATTGAPGATAATAARPLTETVAPVAQSPTATPSDAVAATAAAANGRADVATETRLAELKAGYMAAVNHGLTAAELRELNALLDDIEADVDQRLAELKRAHRHLRETTLSAAAAHWGAVVTKVAASCSGSVLEVLAVVQVAAITALHLEDYKVEVP